MIDRSASLVNLLTYSDTKRLLLGSRRHLHVNKGFSNEDRIVIENLYIFEAYGAKKLIKEFPNKGWGLQGHNKLL